MPQKKTKSKDTHIHPHRYSLFSLPLFCSPCNSCWSQLQHTHTHVHILMHLSHMHIQMLMEEQQVLNIKSKCSVYNVIKTPDERENYRNVSAPLRCCLWSCYFGYHIHSFISCCCCWFYSKSAQAKGNAPQQQKFSFPFWRCFCLTTTTNKKVKKKTAVPLAKQRERQSEWVRSRASERARKSHGPGPSVPFEKLTIKNGHFTFFALSSAWSLFCSVFELFVVVLDVCKNKVAVVVFVFVFDLLISICYALEILPPS